MHLVRTVSPHSGVSAHFPLFSVASEEPITPKALTTGIKWFHHFLPIMWHPWEEVHHISLKSSSADTFYSFSPITVRGKKTTTFNRELRNWKNHSANCKLTVEPSLPPLLRLFFLGLDFLLCICENKRRSSVTASLTRSSSNLSKHKETKVVGILFPKSGTDSLLLIVKAHF